MGKCVNCKHYPWDTSFDPSQIIVFRKCHPDSGPRQWTVLSRDGENTCKMFEEKEVEESTTEAPAATGRRGRRPANAAEPVVEPQVEPAAESSVEVADASNGGN